MICKNCGRDNCKMTKIKLPTACYHRSTALGPCASCVDRHVREVADASRDCVAHIAGPFTADDWQGMYHVAAKRAQEWEDKAKALQAKLATAVAVVETLKWCDHSILCPAVTMRDGIDCNCGAGEANKRLAAAHAALRTEVKS